MLVVVRDISSHAVIYNAAALLHLFYYMNERVVNRVTWNVIILLLLSS